MAMRVLLASLALLASVTGQTYRVCMSSSLPAQCQSLEIGGSQAACSSVNSRVDCALRLSRGEADVGFFSEEELLVLTSQTSDLRVVASVRDLARVAENSAFEAVAVVPSRHVGGLAGLRGGAYCHPGLDTPDLRWSPRVLKTLEYAAAQSDRCPSDGADGRSADALETANVAEFFSAGCRPGAWSANASEDAALKAAHPSLCSLCGSNNCNTYTIDMGVNVAGVSNSNRHVQALECLRQRALASTDPAVAYVAWLHVREYFTMRNPGDADSFSLLCPDGSLQPLSSTALANNTAPCAFLRQPWPAVVASPSTASAVLASLRSWWPEGASSTSSAAAWQTALFSALSGGGSSARLTYLDAPVTVANYTQAVRTVASPDSSVGCVSSRRWCTKSATELAKCTWLRASAHVLGLQPALSCIQRASVLECLQDIRDSRADLISSPSNYGYIARSHYKLSPVKLVQNPLASQTRVVAFLKASAAESNVTRFENLRGRTACFPEYGGLAYVSFVRAAQERGVVPDTECDYAAALGEFFSSACAPGALDAAHALSEQSSYNATHLCTSCRPVNANLSITTNEHFCSWDYSNLYYGNNGSLACLSADKDLAVLNTQNINAHLTALNIQPSSLRALCRNNSLALTTGVAVDDNCALAHVVDAEILTRRDDPLRTALSVLLDALEAAFGYSAGGAAQLINLELFSPFDGRSDLLFKDSTIGLTEAAASSPHAAASNYMQLFAHLDVCSAAPVPAPARAPRAAAVVALTALTALLANVMH